MAPPRIDNLLIYGLQCHAFSNGQRLCLEELTYTDEERRFVTQSRRPDFPSMIHLDVADPSAPAGERHWQQFATEGAPPCAAADYVVSDYQRLPMRCVGGLLSPHPARGLFVGTEAKEIAMRFAQTRRGVASVVRDRLFAILLRTPDAMVARIELQPGGHGERRGLVYRDGQDVIELIEGAGGGAYQAVRMQWQGRLYQVQRDAQLPEAEAMLAELAFVAQRARPRQLELVFHGPQQEPAVSDGAQFHKGTTLVRYGSWHYDAEVAGTVEHIRIQPEQIIITATIEAM